MLSPSRLPAACCCAALIAIVAAPAPAAKWEILPSVTLDETYTDNVSLAPPGFERSDWITTVTPRILVRATGDRLRLDADYFPQLLYWADEGRSRFLHAYSVGGTAEFVKQYLFLDFKSTQTQSNASLAGPQPESNVNLTSNRTSVRTDSVSPYLRFRASSYAEGELRATLNRVETDSALAFSDSTARIVDFRLASGPTYKVFTWSANYHKEHIDYSGTASPDVDFQYFTVNLRRLVASELALLATGGYEDNDYITNGPEPRGNIWSAGAEWNPGPRTHLLATVGRRFFGPTRRFEFNHRTRLTVWDVSYTQDITTSRSQFAVPATIDTAGYLNTLFTTSIPDPVARLAAVNAFIARNALASSFDQPVNFFSSVPYLEKRLRGSAGIHGVRNTVLVDAFRDYREALAPEQIGGDFAVSTRTRQTGGSLNWTSTLSPRTSSTLSVGMSRVDFIDSTREDKRRFIRASLVRQVHPRVSASLLYRRLVNSSNVPGSDYRENAGTLIVSVRF